MLATALLLAACAAAPAHPLAQGDHVRELTVANVARNYLVHIPPTVDPARPVPIVLAFHPAAMNAGAMARFSGLNDTADREGFVVVYPNGTGATPFFLYWDAGGVRGRPSDDVGYVARLLDDLATIVNLDAKRVYATGMSNGGMMCYRLAVELSDRIAAIAAVSGTMALEDGKPARPVSVMHFHGTKDGLVYYTGPDERIPKNLKFLSVDACVKFWAKLNGCPEEPVSDILPGKDDAGTSVRRTVFGPGRDGAEVILYAIEGGGHTWPGRKPRSPFLGKSTSLISANETMWAFFQKHPMK